MIGLDASGSRKDRRYCIAVAVAVAPGGLERERSVLGGLMCRDRSGDGGGDGIEGVSMKRPWNGILWFAIFASFLIRCERVRDVSMQVEPKLNKETVMDSLAF